MVRVKDRDSVRDSVRIMAAKYGRSAPPLIMMRVISGHVSLWSVVIGGDFKLPKLHNVCINCPLCHRTVEVQCL